MNVNNFGPFSSETWGSVSDWTMVAVTAFTARFIWKTLKSQTRVQSLQQKITDIEGLRHKYEIMPVFELEKEDSLLHISDGYLNVIVNFKLTNVGKYEAKDFTFKLERNGIWKIVGGGKSINSFKILPKGYIMISISADIPNESIDGVAYDHYKSQLESEISFKDLNKNQYHQTINYLLVNSNEKLDISSPEEDIF